MKSENFDQAKKFYAENKKAMIALIHDEFHGEIEYQEELDQVAVWFSGFSICYQNSDINGNGKGEPHWNNEGANGGLDELREILKNDDRFNALIAKNECWENEYLNAFISDFCADFAERHKIANMFECNDE